MLKVHLRQGQQLGSNKRFALRLAQNPHSLFVEPTPIESERFCSRTEPGTTETADERETAESSKMLARLVLLVAALAVAATAEPLKDTPYTPTDADSEERSNSIYTTLSDDGPMAGMGTRRLEPLPTVNPKAQASESIYMTLTHDSPMAGMGERKLRQ
ncbi:unnamed protein product [Phytophthora lilii]|uniref:Unnamed protein product n=1 Tax=Phytophthora lilii TaxID=2077276 RepID=A0A9W6WN68_9STRA|nr:unnamed protein product [Phytophthora lilii]